MVSRIVQPLLSLHGWPVYFVVGALVFSEAALMLGFIFPGETAAIFGGVIASQGHVSLPAIVAVVVGCAIVGDSVGYLLGTALGPRVLELRLLRRRRQLIDAGLEQLRRRGALAVFVARFVAVLRAVVPGISGISRMRYRTFVWGNATGGVVWGIGYAVLGYAAGHAYRRVAQISGDASIGLLVALAALYVGAVIWARRRQQRLLASMRESKAPRTNETSDAKGIEEARAGEVRKAQEPSGKREGTTWHDRSAGRSRAVDEGGAAT
jgi:membrane-associated protein